MLKYSTIWSLPCDKSGWHFCKKMTEGLSGYELCLSYPNNPPDGFAGPLYTKGHLNSMKYLHGFYNCNVRDSRIYIKV